MLNHTKNNSRKFALLAEIRELLLSGEFYFGHRNTS